MRSWVRISLLGLLFATVAFAQSDAPPVPLKAMWNMTALEADGQAELGVLFEVPAKYHVTDSEFGLFFIETVDSLGLTFAENMFPKGVSYREERAYRGPTLVRIPVTIADDAVPGTYSWQVKAGYQMCQEFGTEICFLPVEKTVTITAEIVPAGSGATVTNEKIWNTATGDPGDSTEKEKKLSLEQRLIAALEEGSWFAFLLVFVGGILASFTPCVYPVIPITIGYIGGASAGRPLKGFFISCIFALGIAIVYSTLGLISAASGNLFGSISGSPVVTISIMIIFGLMGFSMLGAFDLAIPASLQSRLMGPGKAKGLLEPLILGMASGLVMAPCVGPVIVALLAWVAKSGDLFYGWSLLFVFSFGLGLLFLVIGTFSGAIQALPQAGSWMEIVKKSFGWILLAGALYMGRLMIPEPYYLASWSVLLIMFSIFNGFFDPLTEESGAGSRIWKGITVFTLFLGGILLYQAIAPNSPSTVATAGREVEWLVNKEEEAIGLARRDNKPMIVDVYADWCVACVELDEKTYTVPEVADRLDNFVRLKLDFTKETPWVKEMKMKYKITGMPTVILYDGDRTEKTRFTGFLPAKDFVALLDEHQL